MMQVKSQDFARYNREIGKVDKEMRKAMRKRLKNATAPVVQDVKQAALSLPSGQGQSGIRAKNGKPSLRASIAAAVGASVRMTGKGAGAHIRISRDKFLRVSDRGNRNLSWYVEGRPKRGWKHPVFGAAKDKPETWPIQKPTPFLGVTVDRHKKNYRKEVSEVVWDALKECKIPTK